jgi:hypothetical protein
VAPAEDRIVAQATFAQLLDRHDTVLTCRDRRHSRVPLGALFGYTPNKAPGGVDSPP